MSCRSWRLSREFPRASASQGVFTRTSRTPRKPSLDFVTRQASRIARRVPVFNPTASGAWIRHARAGAGQTITISTAGCQSVIGSGTGRPFPNQFTGAAGEARRRRKAELRRYVVSKIDRPFICFLALKRADLPFRRPLSTDLTWRCARVPSLSSIIALPMSSRAVIAAHTAGGFLSMLKTSPTRRNAVRSTNLCATETIKHRGHDVTTL